MKSSKRDRSRQQGSESASRSHGQQKAASGEGKQYGEGNYEATRQYNEATKKFIDAGRVPQAARDAAPKTPEEAVELKQAEQAALLRAKDAPPRAEQPTPAGIAGTAKLGNDHAGR